MYAHHALIYFDLKVKKSKDSKQPKQLRNPYCESTTKALFCD